MYKNYLKKNLDAYYFAVNTFIEFPGMENKNVLQAMYDEFGKERFAKNTFDAYILVRTAKTHSEILDEIFRRIQT